MSLEKSTFDPVCSTPSGYDIYGGEPKPQAPRVHLTFPDVGTAVDFVNTAIADSPYEQDPIAADNLRINVVDIFEDTPARIGSEAEYDVLIGNPWPDGRLPAVVTRERDGVNDRDAHAALSEYIVGLIHQTTDTHS